MKTVLVTGATGFLGSHLTRGLLGAGYHVSILKRKKSSLDRIKDIFSDLEAFDIEDGIEAPFNAIRIVDVIIHAATCYGKNNEEISEILWSNMIFPLKLMEAASKYKTKVFINTDTFFNVSNSKYGYLNHYVLSKRQFLEWGRIISDKGGVNFRNVRLEHIYGEGDDASKFVTNIIRRCLWNESEIHLTYGDQERDFIYIGDVVDAYLCLIENLDKSRAGFEYYELGCGDSVSIRYFVETVHHLANSASVLKFGALPYRDNEIMKSVADNSAFKKLGWQCSISLEEGLGRVLKYERDMLSKSAKC